MKIKYVLVTSTVLSLITIVILLCYKEPVAYNKVGGFNPVIKVDVKEEKEIVMADEKLLTMKLRKASLVTANDSTNKKIEKKLEKKKKEVKAESVKADKIEGNVRYLFVNGKKYDKVNVPCGYTPEQLYNKIKGKPWHTDIKSHMGPENNYAFERGILEIEQDTNVSAKFLLAVAGQESGWCNATPPQAPRNYFGWGVLDSGISESAYVFNESQDTVILEVLNSFRVFANNISRSYLTRGSKYWDGNGTGGKKQYATGEPFIYGEDVGYTVLGISKSYNSLGTWHHKIQQIMNEF